MRALQLVILMFFLNCATTKEAFKTHAVCPVTHESVEVTADTPRTEYNGKTYYFCCRDCPVEFKKNPEKFTQR
jgi:YHS domain-containing protein